MSIKDIKPTISFFPEETFLNPHVTIDPVEMSRTLIDRAKGIIGTLREGSLTDTVFHPPLLASALEQVQGNLECLEKVLELWSAHDQEEENRDNIEIPAHGKFHMLFGGCSPTFGTLVNKGIQNTGAGLEPAPTSLHYQK